MENLEIYFDRRKTIYYIYLNIKNIYSIFISFYNNKILLIYIKYKK